MYIQARARARSRAVFKRSYMYNVYLVGVGIHVAVDSTEAD